MQSAILPFGPVLRDFIRNLWVLRLFLLLVVLSRMISCAFAAWLEDVPLASRGAWVVPLMKTMDILNSFIGSLLFGLLIWVVQQSLSGHTLKKSKYMLFPTEEDL